MPMNQKKKDREARRKEIKGLAAVAGDREIEISGNR
jgi:hypothetical protein